MSRPYCPRTNELCAHHQDYECHRRWARPMPAEAPRELETADHPKQFLTTIELERVEVTGWNPRKDFDAEELQGLADSIKAEGLRDPIKVRPKGPEYSGRYQLVDGERRLRAHRLLGWTTIRAIVEDMDDAKVRMEMLISTLQRAELRPMEIAEALQAMLAEDKDLTQEALAAKIGKSQGWVSNHLRLLRAPDDLQKLIISGKITPRHAQVLMPYAGTVVYKHVMEDLNTSLVSNGGMTVERLVQHVQGTIANDYQGERVLNFTDPCWTHQKLLPNMDKEACKDCEDRREVDLGGKKCLVCFRSDCFNEKLEAAKKAKEEARTHELKDMKEGKAPINTDLLSYGEYDRLSLADFDKTACQECPHRRTTATEVEICMDPACFRAKKTAKTKADNKAARDLKTQAKVAAEAHAATRSGPLNARELRLVLEVFAKSDDFDPDWLEHWTGPDAAEEIDLLEDLIDFVPDEDLPKALMFVVLRRECEHYDADHAAIIAAIGELGTPSTHKPRKRLQVREDAEGEVTEGDEAAELEDGEEEPRSDVDEEFMATLPNRRCNRCDNWDAKLGERNPRNGCAYGCFCKEECDSSYEPRLDMPPPTAEEIYPVGDRFYVVHVSEHSTDILTDWYTLEGAEREKKEVIEHLCDFAHYDPEDIHIVEANGQVDLFKKMSNGVFADADKPIVVEGEPFPGSKPWNIADDPIQGAHMP